MRFVETPVFTARLHEALDDAGYRALQIALVLRPEQGAVIAGSHGLRKLRWALAGRGKRGGLRVIYYWDPNDSVVYMLYLYAKNEQGDLTPAQARALGRLVREEFK
jgi:mRNA-degrading endonuclease RelE of RelBE toxin-antitoxin system